MADQRCANCSHWTGNGQDDAREARYVCEYLTTDHDYTPPYRVSFSDRFNGVVYTSADFGCVEWTAAEEE